MKEKSFEACLAKQEEIGFNWKTFDDLKEASKGFQVAQWITDYSEILKEAKKSGKKLLVLKTNRMKWEIRDFTDISQFREVATQDDIRNLVFVSHGEQTGKIIDSRINLLPSSAFGWLSPGLQSISLFSCHTDQLLRTFQADKQLQAQESFFPVRYLGLVNANEIFESKNQAPSPALSEFLEDLDRELYRAETGNERAQSVQALLSKNQWPAYQKPAECSFSFPGTRVLKGAASLKLRVGDGQAVYWLGMIYPETPDSVWYKSRCDWLMDGKNELYIENGSPKDKIIFEKPEFTMLLRGNGIHLKQSQTEFFYRPSDCAIKGTRFEFLKFREGDLTGVPAMAQEPCVPKPSRETRESRE